MVYDAETTARNAEATTSWASGMCLQFSRSMAGIPAVYPDASTAWRNTIDRHPGDRNPPRGCMVYWTGGSQGYGHITPSLGGGKVRSSDYPSSGRVGTTDIGWIERNWGLPFAGWAWDVNGVTIPHGAASGGSGGGSSGEDETVPKFSRTRLTKDLTIKPDTWTSLPWDVISAGDAGKVGQAYVMLGASPFSMSLNATVTPTNPKADTIRTRFIERQDKGSNDWQTTETYPAAEHKVTGGATYLVDSRTQKLPAKTRLVAQVHIGDGGTVKAADWCVLYF